MVEDKQLQVFLQQQSVKPWIPADTGWIKISNVLQINH